jgi:subfamily B ATP-binding cassette protein MsbA
MLERKLSSIAYIPLMIIVFSVIQSGFSYASTYLNAWVGARISSNLKYDLFRKLMKYEPMFFDKQTSGIVQMRFNSDVDGACTGLLKHLKQFTTRIVSSLSLLCVLCVNSWQLAIVAFSILLGAIYPLSTIRRKISGIMTKSMFSSAEIMTHYTEAFHGNRVIASYNLQDHQAKRFLKTLSQVFRLEMKMAQRTGLLSPLMHFIIAVGVAMIIWLGNYLIANASLTIGEFVSFITALLMLYQPIKSIGNDYSDVQKSFMAMDRVFQLLKDKPKMHHKANAIKLLSIKRSISYKNVNFEYLKGRPVLKDICLDVAVGETVALVGNSGGGKSTLVNLLPRFYDVTSGEICIDGVNIAAINLFSLRDKISVVFQDNFLFSGTIRDNIIIGNCGASEANLNSAVEAACLDEFVSSLPAGLDTEIGERGVILSGGQKQRIAIARALLKNAPLVILDEATSALDNTSESVVQKAIDNLMEDRTVFIIAHRLSTIRNAGRIVVVNNGRIAEIGSHDELISNKDGIYYSLYNTQMK